MFLKRSHSEKSAEAVRIKPEFSCSCENPWTTSSFFGRHIHCTHSKSIFLSTWGRKPMQLSLLAPFRYLTHCIQDEKTVSDSFAVSRNRTWAISVSSERAIPYPNASWASMDTLWMNGSIFFFNFLEPGHAPLFLEKAFHSIKKYCCIILCCKFSRHW